MLDNDEFDVKANLGVIVRGSIRDLDEVLSSVKKIIRELDCQIVFKEVSADRLWITREVKDAKGYEKAEANRNEDYM